jgi:hypothetical protein
MSNHLAIAAVTAALKRSLQEVLTNEVPGATVTALRPAPAADGNAQSVNIYLYQVTPNASFRGADLPTRRDGQLVNRPQIGLNLHYLFSFYGDEASLEPQQALGSIVRALHSQPILTREMIAQTLADPTFSFVSGSDLHLAVESVKFTPTGLSFEEFSKLWSVLFQIPYVLSVTYEGSVVLLDRSISTRPALPVRSTRVQVAAARPPAISTLLSRGTPTDPFVAGRSIGPGDTLLLVGERLAGESARVVFTGDLPVEPTSVVDDRITVVVPAALPAGRQALMVALGLPGSTGELTSNPVPFTLTPRVGTRTVGAATVDVQVTPPVQRRQQAVLILRETPSPSDRPPRSLAIDRGTPALADPAASGSLSFPRAGIPAGTYLVSVRVDGADSPLDFDETAERFVGPTVTLP